MMNSMLTKLNQRDICLVKKMTVADERQHPMQLFCMGVLLWWLSHSLKWEKESLTGPGEGNGNPLLGFSSGTVVKNLPAMQETLETQIRSLGLVFSRKISWRRKWQPTTVFLPGKSHWHRSLVGCSPWDCTGSDTTEVTEHSTIRN